MSIPLSEMVRPTTFDDIVGQDHILGKGKLLRNILESGYIPNLIFYGPSGTGKTTLAKIISSKTNKKFYKLNCTTASTADIKDVIKDINTFSAPNGILLYLDEIQYFNKKQQQTLLDFIESGKITLIASTTENPYFYIYSAVLSRSTVFEFKKIDYNHIEKALKRAVLEYNKLQEDKVIVEDNAIEYLAKISGGDVRKGINFLENSIMATLTEGGKKLINLNVVSQITDFGSSIYDREADNHYDTLSAFQKSMRGSDPDAAVYYLAKLLAYGDIKSACRRLMVCACEDVGLANPQIMPIVKSCVDIALHVGMPEAKIPLSNAVIMVSISPKSNSAYKAINSAMEDLNSGKVYDIPRHLKNKHFDGAEVKIKGQFYKYPHEYPNNWCKQAYLPKKLENKKYYTVGNNKNEKAYENYWKNIKC